MAAGYDSDKLLADAMKAITEKKLVFFEDVYGNIGIAKSTLYDKFPEGSDGHKAMSEAMHKNKIDIKVAQRRKWFKSDSATLQIALYRLLASAEERRNLNQQYIEHSADEKSIDTFLKQFE